jgi:hypothetical protein
MALKFIGKDGGQRSAYFNAPILMPGLTYLTNEFLIEEILMKSAIEESGFVIEHLTGTWKALSIGDSWVHGFYSGVMISGALSGECVAEMQFLMDVAQVKSDQSI